MSGRPLILENRTTWRCHILTASEPLPGHCRHQKHKKHGQTYLMPAVDFAKLSASIRAGLFASASSK